MNKKNVRKSIKEIEKLQENTPEGRIVDADTILVDYISVCDYEFPGFAQDIFNIWKKSKDKKAVEEMFYEFTDTDFETYLDECIYKISRQ